MRAIPPDLERYCEETRRKLEEHYLQFPDTEPWRQSGMSGPLDRWTYLRKPVADCVDRDGSFLDLCCANGFLLECVLKWTRDRGVSVTPFGMDISPKLIALAQARLPAYRQNLLAGNSFAWEPPERMDFVSVMCDLFPREYEDDFIDFVVRHHLKPDGRLLIHGTGPKGTGRRQVERCFTVERFNQVGQKMGYDPVKDREVYVAILMQ